MQIKQALSWAQDQLIKVSEHSRRLDSLILAEFVLAKDRSWVLSHPEQPLTPSQQEQFKALISQRSSGVPQAYLTGKREFYGLDIIVTPEVLIPRVESEQLVDWAVELAPEGARILDIGTGSGALAIALAKHRPDLELVATDISPGAIQIAQKNADIHKVDIDFRQSGLLDGVKGNFQLVMANLPYLKDDSDLMISARYEPEVALFGGADGLELYRRLFAVLPRHLEEGGYFICESDPWQQDGLIEVAASRGLSRVKQSYFGLVFTVGPLPA